MATTTLYLVTLPGCAGLMLSSDGRWFTRLPGRDPSRVRLICFPSAGGGAALFRGWREHLPRSVELLLPLLPGRESRLCDPPFTDIIPLVEAVGATVGEDPADAGLAIFGHSMGALIAFELARYLRRHAARSQPVHVFVSACRAPHLPGRHGSLHTLSDADLVRRLMKLNGTPASLMADREFLRLVLPAVRADFTLCDGYRYVDEPPLACPISAFGGGADPEVTRSELAEWQRHTSAAFDVTLLPGDHFYLRTSPGALLRHMMARLHDNQALTVAPRSPNPS